MIAAASAFDALAAGYDDRFTRTTLGDRMRRAVWRRIDPFIRPGIRVLDVGCGTGVDAVHAAALGARVLGVDASPAMVEQCRAAIAAAGVGEHASARVADAERLDSLGDVGRFDIVVSDFGVLNCTPALERVAAGLGALTRPGARAFLCVMGPLVPWEWVWFLARGDLRSAFRRLRPGGARWRGVRIVYPPLRRIRTAFGADFRVVRTAAIGALLPPPFAESWAARHPSLVGLLDRTERRLERVPPLPILADHRLVELIRR